MERPFFACEVTEDEDAMDQHRDLLALPSLKTMAQISAADIRLTPEDIHEWGLVLYGGCYLSPAGGDETYWGIPTKDFSGRAPHAEDCPICAEKKVMDLDRLAEDNDPFAIAIE